MEAKLNLLKDKKGGFCSHLFYLMFSFGLKSHVKDDTGLIIKFFKAFL